MHNSPGSEDIIDTIEDFDIFNSSVIFLSEVAPKAALKITKYGGRLDLLAESLYGSERNYGLLGILNRIGSTNLEVGSELTYIPDESLSSLYLGK